MAPDGAGTVAAVAGGRIGTGPVKETTGLALTMVGAPVEVAREVTAAACTGEPFVRCDGAAGELRRISEGSGAGGALEPETLTNFITGLALATATTTTISHLIRMHQLSPALLTGS